MYGLCLCIIASTVQLKYSIIEIKCICTMAMFNNVIVQPPKIDRNHLCFCLSLCRWIRVQIGESRPEMFPWYIRAFIIESFQLLRSEGEERAETENLFAFPISRTAIWVSFLASLLYCYDEESWARFELSELIVSICLIVSLFIISRINLLFYISCGNLQKLDVVEDRRAGPQRTNSVSFCVNVCGQKAICWKCPAFYSASLAPTSRHGACWWHKRVSSCSKQSD